MSELLVSEWLIFFSELPGASSPFGCFAPPLSCSLSLLPSILPYFCSISAFHPPQLLSSCGPWLCYILCLFVTLRPLLFLCAAPRNFFSLLFCSSFSWFVPRHSFSSSISIFRFSLAFALCGSLPYYFSLSLCCAVPMCAVPRCSPSFLLFFH